MATGDLELCVGLVATPAQIERVRTQTTSGPYKYLWQQFLARIEQSPGEGQFGLIDLAFVALITRDATWQSRAVAKLLEVAHQPASRYIHPDAGCTTLHGVHLAHGLCIGTDWLWGLLNRDQREAALGAIAAHCLENLRPAPEGIRDESDGNGRLLLVRRMDRNDQFCLHPDDAQVNNWDFWFSGAIYMGACLIDRAFLHPDSTQVALEWGHYYDTGYDIDADRITRWKKIARERIETGIRNQVGQDGEYAEGTNYAAYGGFALSLALAALEHDGDDSLYSASIAKIPMWRRNQVVSTLEQGNINFNDALVSWRCALDLTSYLTRRTNCPTLQAQLLESIAFSGNKVDALTLLNLDMDRQAAPQIQLPASQSYPLTGTVIWRPEKDGLFVAAQSGNHGGAHQHCDRNTIFLSAYGEHLLVDTGDCRHMPVPYASFHETTSHNCLLINGEGQIGDNSNPVNGALLECSTDGDTCTALLDASECYANADLCRRRLVYARPDVLMIADRTAGDVQSLTWMAQGNNRDGKASWQGSDRHLTLTRPNASLHLFFLEELTSWRVESTPMDDKLDQILRLAIHLEGRRSLVIAIAVRASEPPPIASREQDCLHVDFRGERFTATWAGDSAELNGSQYAT